jgi:hypothetical protein
MASTERSLSGAGESRRTILIVVAVVSILLICGLIWLIKRPGHTAGAVAQPRLEGAFRPGSPEFEKYKGLILRDEPEADQAKRALGDWVMTLHTTVRNFSGRTINGLEMYAAVIDHQGKPVKDRTVIVIPERQPDLENNKTVPVSIMLEGMKDSDDRANIKMEVTAFKFK